MQFLSLTSGSWPDAFQSQLESIRDIRSYVGTVLGCAVEDSTRKPGTIYLQRLVFTKVSSKGEVTGNGRMINAITYTL